jgi:hypothetical protein
MQAAKPKRTTFFNKLAALITPRTILGLDANCVPDTSLDTSRPSTCTSAYENDGHHALDNIVDDNGLLDVAREQLGTDGTRPFFTSHHRHGMRSRSAVRDRLERN